MQELSIAGAQKHVLDAFGNADCSGISLVMPLGMSRRQLVFWAIEELVAADNEELRALIVLPEREQLKRLRKELRYRRRQQHRRPITINTFTHESTPPLALTEVNFTTGATLIRLGDLPAESIEVLILDEPA